MGEWELIKKGSALKKPSISFSIGENSKYIRFSNSFLTINELGNLKYIKIFSDKGEDTLKVGFLFQEDKSDEAYKISISGKTGTGYISGAGIFSHLGINKEMLEEMLFEPKEESLNNDKLYVIEVALKK